jgi:FMN phosphatase YigB (HAD superfamily)
MQNIEALLLDLDGTLVDIDGDAFLEAYLDAAAAGLNDLVDPDRFREALWSAAIPLMVEPHASRTNADALWAALADLLDTPAPTLRARVDAWLAETDLTRILPGGGPVPGAHRLITAARRRRLRLAVATMPIYPLAVVQERLRRGGLADVPWDVVATEEMHAVKPQPAYWLELADRLAVTPAACLVVGDDYFRDMAAREVGMQTFYVGPPLPGLNTGPGGSLEVLAARLEAVAAIERR